jgi:hypothetical protein
MGVAVNVGYLVFVIRIIKEDFSIKEYLPFFMIIPFLCLSLKPQQSVFLPDLCRIFLQIFALMSFYFIRKRSYLALAVAFLSSYSMVPGLLVWFAGLFQIFLSTVFGNEKRKWIVYGAVWSAAGVFCWISYFFLLPGNLYGERITPYIVLHIFKTAEFMLYYIGGALFYSPKTGIPVGLFFSAVIVVIAWTFVKNKSRFRDPNIHLWAGFLVWSLLCMVLIAFGRAQYGLMWGASERYVFSSLNITVAVLVLLMYVLKGGGGSYFRIVSRIVCALCILGVISYLFHAPAGAFRNKETKEKLVPILRNFENEDDSSLEKIYPSASKVREMGRFLKEHDYNVFHK